jgi:uncharacterized protein (DUF2384 family)
MQRKSQPAKRPDKGAVVTKAVVRAGDLMALSNAVLARVIGLSGSTITRMRRGQYVLSPDEKPFELAALLIRVYRSLDSIVGGDSAVAAKWLDTQNNVLNDKPVKLIQTVDGLLNVLQYLDARRAVI